MKHIALLALPALVLAGCEVPQDGSAPPLSTSDMAMSRVQAGSMPDVETDVAQGQRADGNPSSTSFLAYRYSYGFSLPGEAVAPTAESHMEACMSAGPMRCQVLGSDTSQMGEDRIRASLRFRAEPDWLRDFIAQVESDIDAARGRVVSSDMSAEDLTRRILDTDARLKAQTTLRDRLQNLLATRDGELADLLAVERELARVQGEIESATTTLNVLRQRVTMSEVAFNYLTRDQAVSNSTFAPIGRALRGFVSNAVNGLALLINAVSFLLPILLLLGFPLWAFARWYVRRATRTRPVRTRKNDT